LCLSLMLGCKVQAQTQAATSDEVIAIDVLLLPDEQATQFSTNVNTKLREQYPQGYALDAKHNPHITLLQRYVRTSDLASVETAIQKVMMGQDITQLVLNASSFYPAPSGAQGLLLLEIDPTPELKSLQAKVIDAVQPYTIKGGTAAAFVQDSGELISPFTIEFVEGFIPKASGDKFLPHITLGLAPMDY
jgi:hypothetical protein